MYIITSLSGSSDWRNSIWAMMTFATSSSIGVPRNTMRSLSRRENRSQPALAPVRLLDDRGHQRRRDISMISRHRGSGADSQATSAAREKRQSLPSLRPGTLPALPAPPASPSQSGGRRRLARRSSPPAGRRHGTSTIPSPAPARRGRASACASTANRARSGPGGCRGRRTSRPGSRPGPSCASPAPRRRGEASRRRSRAGARTARFRGAVSCSAYPKDISGYLGVKRT